MRMPYENLGTRDYEVRRRHDARKWIGKGLIYTVPPQPEPCFLHRLCAVTTILT